jgi:hypothetical protein
VRRGGRERYLADAVGQVKLFVHDLGVHDSSVAVVERRLAGEHLVQQRAEAPPVHLLAIASAIQQLRCCNQEERCEFTVGDTTLGCKRAKKRVPKYSGVPHTVAVFTSLLTKPSLEMPKSVMQMCPSAVSKRFSGFRSLHCSRDVMSARRTVEAHSLAHEPVDDALVVEVLEA